MYHNFGYPKNNLPKNAFKNAYFYLKKWQIWAIFQILANIIIK